VIDLKKKSEQNPSDRAQFTIRLLFSYIVFLHLLLSQGANFSRVKAKHEESKADYG